MAKFDVYFDDDLTNALSKLANFEQHARRLLKVAGPILLNEYQKQLVKHQVSGDLYQSLKTKIGKAKNGSWYIVIRPTGKDSQKTPQRNMEKMMVLEFGKEGQPPRPVLSTAVKNAEPKVLDALRKEFDRIVNE